MFHFCIKLVIHTEGGGKGFLRHGVGRPKEGTEQEGSGRLEEEGPIFFFFFG